MKHLCAALLTAASVFAGENEDARFVPLGKPTDERRGPGETVGLGVQATGLVGVKNLEVLAEVSDETLFDTSTFKLTLGEGWDDVQTLLAPPLVEGEGDRVRFGVAVLPPGRIDGEATFAVTVRTSDSFTANTVAHLRIGMISVGPSVDERDAFLSGLGLDVSLYINTLTTALKAISWGEVKQSQVSGGGPSGPLNAP